jgi:hypothetical protein
MAVIDVLGGTEQDVLDLQAKGRPSLPAIDRRRLYHSDGGYIRAVDIDGFDQFDVNQTIFSYRGAGRKWAAALAGRTAANPAKMIWWGDSVTELMYGAPVYRFRERLLRFNNNKMTPGWINAAPLSSDIAGGVNILQPYVFRLSTGSYGASGGTENIPQERGLGLYAFRLASGSVLTLYSDPDQDGTWTNQVVATPSFAKAEIHFAACGTDASVGSLEVRINGTLVQTINGYDAALGAGVWESAHKYLWDPSIDDTAQTITLTATGGSFIIEGMYLAGENETVWCYNGGNAGERYEDLLAVFSGHVKASAWEVMESLAVDAVQFAFGINDYSDGAQDMYDDVSTVIDEARQATTDPSISVLVPYATGSRADWPEWVVAAKDACSDKAIPVLDTSWMLETAAGIADPDELIGGDDVHQEQAGGELWASMVSKFWLGDDINWYDLMESYMGEVQYRFLQNKVSASFTGESFSPGLIVSKHDSGKAYLLLQDDKTSAAATTGLFAEVSANGRGATTLLGASGLNGLAGFRFRAAATWTDTSAPTDLEVINCASGSVTVGVRATFLAGGGFKLPEMTPPAGSSNNAILATRDVSGRTQFGIVHPDSSFRALSSDTFNDPDVDLQAAVQPTGALAWTLDRAQTSISSVTSFLTTQRMYVTGIALKAGMTVTNITFVVSSTAASAPTNWWYALYSYHATAPVLLRQTADQTTGAMNANTAYTKALTSAYVVPTSGFYYIGIMVKATTVPTLFALQTSPGQIPAGQVPVLQGQTSDTGLTTTAPNPCGTSGMTGGSFRPWAWIT